MQITLRTEEITTKLIQYRLTDGAVNQISIYNYYRICTGRQQVQNTLSHAGVYVFYLTPSQTKSRKKVQGITILNTEEHWNGLVGPQNAALIYFIK